MKSNFKKIDNETVYAGFPVALVSSYNKNEEENIIPISSFFCLNQTLVFAVSKKSQCYENLKYSGYITLNIPESKNWQKIEKLANLYFNHFDENINETDFYQEINLEFKKLNLEKEPTLVNGLSRFKDCPISLDCNIKKIIPDNEFMLVSASVKSVYVNSDYLTSEDKIDSKKWEPLIYKLKHFVKNDSNK